MKRIFRLAALALAAAWGVCASGDTRDPLSIYVDADYSNHPESSLAIERGLHMALKRVDFTLLGRPVKIVRKDHRGNAARSKRHLRQYLDDASALLIVSGIHSPPLLAYRDFINEKGILVLVPWAAAGPITRYPSSENWIFRLSLDDTKAGDVITRFAIEEKGFRRPFLMLERTGWGKSNEKSMAAALERLGVTNYQIGWFDWDVQEAGTLRLLDNARSARSDVIILVANALEGSTIARVLADRSDAERLPLLSHWGITGGSFEKKVSYAQRQAVDLHFLQTRFSFLNEPLSNHQRQVLDATIQEFSEVRSAVDITSPTGFIHAYDLGLLLVQAASQLEATQSIESARSALRAGLERLDTPVQGLIKRYVRPFSSYSATKPDAHEALSARDFVMATYGPEGQILLHSWRYD